MSSVQVYQGNDYAYTGERFAIVVSRYNESITRRLLEGSVATLRQAGVPEDQIDVAWVPGAWELPLIVRRMAAQGSYAAIIGLGAVIRGETSHDEHINRQVSHAFGQLSLEFDRPILFGLLTCHTMEQAIHRAGGNVGNKGEECAAAALEMVALLRKLPGAAAGDADSTQVSR